MSDIKAYAIDMDRHYGAGTVPAPKENICVTCFKSDFMWSRIRVTASEMGQYDLAVSSFMNPDGIVVDNITTELYYEHNVSAFVGNAGYQRNPKRQIIPEGNRTQIGDSIQKVVDGSIHVEGYVNIWIKVITNNDATSGQYVSKFTICNQQVDIITNIIELEMPKASEYDFRVEYWQYPFSLADYYNVEYFSPEHVEIMKKYQSYYQSLGGKEITATITEEAWGGQTFGKGAVRYPSLVKWTKLISGEMVFDYTLFDKWVALNREVGVDGGVICYSMITWGGKVYYHDEATGTLQFDKAPVWNMRKFKKVWTPFVKSFIKHLDEKGMFDTTFLAFDERPKVDTVIAFIEEFSNKDGKKINLAGAFNCTKENKTFNKIDLVSVHINVAMKDKAGFAQVAKKRKDNNRVTSIYTATDSFPNSLGVSMPVESYWSVLYSYSLGCNCFLRWAYNAYVEKPLEDITHWSYPAGDCFLVYPSLIEGDTDVCPSIRMLGLDMAVRDVNRLEYIRRIRPDLSPKIDKLLSEMVDDYKCTKHVHKSENHTNTMKLLEIDKSDKDRMVADVEALRRKIISIYNECK